jgi:hypothetical protein
MLMEQKMIVNDEKKGLGEREKCENESLAV